ncbi:MAG: TnpV protein [Ruminococcus sp.]|nr:TnpV protein [Ruminococcus sp.]MBR6623792.1 TnpV protein [Ruminococcus sp.]
MTYEVWNTLTQEQQQQVPTEELPMIPTEQLENGLTLSRVIRKDGELLWEMTQDLNGDISTAHFPEYKMKDLMGLPYLYKLNPFIGTYEIQTEKQEASMDEEPIGISGLQWIKFMEKNHPILVEEMRFQRKFLTVARSVDKRADEYWEILDKEYDRTNPRPTGDYEKILAWEQAKHFYIDSTVTREVILVPVTEP